MWTPTANPRPVVDEENLHRTATVDFICVLEGELWLVLEGDDDVHPPGRGLRGAAGHGTRLAQSHR